MGCFWCPCVSVHKCKLTIYCTSQFYAFSFLHARNHWNVLISGSISTEFGLFCLEVFHLPYILPLESARTSRVKPVMAMSHCGLFSLLQCAYFSNREQQKTNIIMSSHSPIIRLSKIKNTLTQPVQVVTLCFPVLIIQCGHGFVTVDKVRYQWLVLLEWALVYLQVHKNLPRFLHPQFLTSEYLDC